MAELSEFTDAELRAELERRKPRPPPPRPRVRVVCPSCRGQGWTNAIDAMSGHSYEDSCEQCKGRGRIMAELA